MYVYFIQITNKDIIKIGKSSNPCKRFYTIQTSNPDKLYLKWLIEYDEQEENLELKLHKIFNKYRKNGEWFNIDIDTILMTLEDKGYKDKLIDFELKFKKPKDIKNPTIFTCDFCERKYTLKSGLNRHIKEDQICSLFRTKILNLQNEIKLLKNIIKETYTEDKIQELIKKLVE